ncbi:unnamed protein product, partial [Closterium sp. NIES-53]
HATSNLRATLHRSAPLPAPSVSPMAPVTSASTQPWVEKYRPKQVSDVAHQQEVVATLKNTLATGNLPHLLFYGPPGTGKTSTALAITKELFGPELYPSRVLELNASDDRGISVVRTKIKDFAGVAVGHGVSGYPCPPFKVIILDEADSMTEDAQNALRRTMELHSRVTRFVFICNYISRIIEPLASRCAKFRFRPLVGQVMTDRLRHIADCEHLSLSDEAFEELSKVSEGDLRRAITTLQSAARLYGSSISAQHIIEVSGVVPASVVTSLLEACRGGAFEAVQSAVTAAVADGYPAAQILSQLFDAATAADDLTDEQKARICATIAAADKNLVDGADEWLQLLDVASSTMRALHNLPVSASFAT